MNPLIKKQLEKVTYADLSKFNPATNTYYIKKYTKPKYDLGRCYLIRLSLELVNNLTSIWATNWNNGTAPSNEYLKVHVKGFSGKLVKVDSVAFDIDAGADLPVTWSGYLPIDYITQISVIN